ncbi:hypothetical protein, conserved [Eimeria necatrix]|uniref:Uncharacterized protein n=1 Tax=Eimeria necatrix TaxID=51315 RepID=U6MGG3_9EIME|nr:hypothetical protein, conserved [Eimeria necatrix]CDJ62148.1 hypothetical protein, conserved [Eimeria necatrix]
MASSAAGAVGVAAAQKAAAAAKEAAAAVKESARMLRWHKALAAAAAEGYKSATLPQGKATLVPTVCPAEASSSSSSSSDSSSSSSSSSKTKVVFEGRYTNFSLGHVWDKYNFLQSHLLLQEALLLQQGQQPDLLQPEHELQLRPVVSLGLDKPKSGPLDNVD